MSEQQQPDIYGQVHPTETPELLKQKLAEFDADVKKLPKDKTTSLIIAQKKCPDLLTDAFKLQFLRCEVFRTKVRV